MKHLILIRVVVLVFVVVFTTLPLLSCSEEVHPDFSDLSTDLVKGQIVLFIHFGEEGYDKEGDYYQYRTIQELTVEQATAFIEKLSDLSFRTMLPPASPQGLGVVLTYKDQTKVYISNATYENPHIPEGGSWYSEEFYVLVRQTLAEVSGGD